MKKNMRNALAISGLAIAIGTSGFALEASAKTTSKIQRSHQERIVRTNKIKEERISTNRRFVMGKVTGISDNSLSITRGTKTFTVNTTSETRVLNHNWKTINLSDIKIGDKVRVSGTITDSVIAAKTVRDISLPTSTTK